MNRALRQALEASPQGRALLAAQEQETRDRRARAKALRKRGRAPGKTQEQRREAKGAARRATRPQARTAGVHWFAKQDSAPRPGARGRIPDDLWIQEMPR